MRPETCPNCGADVPRGAKVCPECGSDESTGWAEDAYAGGLGLPEPEEEFDYDRFVEEEFGGKGKEVVKPRGIRWIWWVVAVMLAALLGFFWIVR